jgi:hypothetical protein
VNQSISCSELNERLKRQAEYIKQLEATASAASNSPPGSSSSSFPAVSNSVPAVSSSIPSVGNGSASVNAAFDEELSQLLDRRRQLIKLFSSEQTLLSTLTLRSVRTLLGRGWHPDYRLEHKLLPGLVLHFFF